MGALRSHWPARGEAATLFCYFSVPIWNCSRGSSDLVLVAPRLSVCGIRRSGALFGVCVYLYVGCVFRRFVLVPSGEPSRGEGRKPQSSWVSGCVSPPAFSCLRAPRRLLRRGALVSGDAALELGTARTLLRRLPVSLELGCQIGC